MIFLVVLPEIDARSTSPLLLAATLLAAALAALTPVMDGRTQAEAGGDGHTALLAERINGT